MAFRRRARRGFSRKGTREQLIWFRQVVTNSDAAAFGSPIAVILFDPATILGGSGLDERFTIRRIKVSVWTRDAFSAAVAQQLQHFTGVYLAGRSETGRSPAMRTAADQETDWLALGATGLGIGAGAGNAQGNPSAAGTTNVGLNPQSGVNPWSFDIRAMRKIDLDQTITLVADDLANGTDGAPTRSARILTALVSVLFQRTRR